MGRVLKAYGYPHRSTKAESMVYDSSTDDTDVVTIALEEGTNAVLMSVIDGNCYFTINGETPVVGQCLLGVAGSPPTLIFIPDASDGISFVSAGNAVTSTVVVQMLS